MAKSYFSIKAFFTVFIVLLLNYGNVHSQCNVQVSGLESEYCISDGSVSLEGYPMGGTLSGAGISGNSFTPSTAGAGTHEIKYVFDTIFYNVYADGTYNPINNTGTSFSLWDDDMTGALPLGFTFNFFGTDYTEVRVSSNGFISFNTSTYNDGCCSGGYIPGTGGPNNFIAFAWTDLNPSENGSFDYFTIGTAPNRVFVLNVTDVYHYSFPTLVTTQLQLYETTNIIEIHTTIMEYSGAVHTMGIENADGTLGYAVEGRNSSVWSAEEEMVQFVPEYCTDSVIVNVTVNDNPAAIDISESEISYGNVESGAVAVNELTLTNNGCASVIIDSLRNTNSAFSFSFDDNQTLGAGSFNIVEVQLQSTSTGDITDTLHVYTDANDTSIVLTATIIVSPAMSVSEDTLEVTINACSGSENVTFNIQNSAAGELNYTITKYEDFFEGFEDGNYNDWYDGNYYTSIEAQSSEVAEGSYALHLFGEDDDGLVRNIEARPTYISYWIIPDFSSYGDGGLKFESESGEELINVEFDTDSYGNYFGERSSGKTFYVYGEEWFFIEFKNIDFENGLFDWYVDGELVEKGLEFGDGGKSGSVSHMSKVIIYSERANNFYVDDIYMGDETQWFNISANSGTLANGESDEIQISMSADGLTSGTYQKYVFINGNDPENLNDTVICRLIVDGTPQAELSTSNIDFGDVILGDSLEKPVTLTNTGCDTLFISSISQTGDSNEFEFTNYSGLTILPGEKLDATVKFKAGVAGTYSSGISISSNTSTQNISLNGNCIVNPTITLSADTLTYDISCNGESSQSFTISNANASNLEYQVEIKDISLEKVLENLNNNYDSIIDLIPYRYDFSYGDADTYIESGGNYMYYNGNKLSTNLGGNLVYSDNVITESSYLGGDGAYFVRKYPGLFVFAGKLDEVSTFQISGSVGSYYGDVEGSLLEYEYNGIVYYGLVKRTYDSNIPSVNHLFITRDANVEQSFSSYPYDDDHEINNLEESSELFYLLYAGTAGAHIDDEATLNIMKAFIESVTPFAPDYISVDNPSGTVNAGSQDINVTVSGTDFNTGTHYRELMIGSNDLDNKLEFITLELNVTGNPELYTEISTLDFGNVTVSDSLDKELAIYNTGCDTLFVTNISSSIEQYFADTTELEILPGESYTIEVWFKPEALQAYPANLTIEANSGNTVIALTGTGVSTGPQMVIDSTSFTMALECENEKSGVFIISNTGEADLVINISDDMEGLTLSVEEATIPAEDSLIVEVTYWGEESLAGTYTGDITVNSNDASNPEKIIGVSITDPYIKVSFIEFDWEEDNICQGEEITVDAGYGFSSYDWSTGAETQTITVSSTGKYIATVVDYNGCESEDSVDVTVHNPVVDLGDDVEFCQGESTSLDAGSDFTAYSWSTAETTQTISVNTTGTYSVTVTDGYTCTADDEIVVTVNDLPVVDLGDDIEFCQGESETLDAGTGFAAYDWSTTETTQTISVNSSGTYTVTVTDANSCENTDEIVVTVNSLPVVDLGADVNITTSENTTLDAGSGFASYLWSDESTSQTLTVEGEVVGVGTHNYSVVVTDANGCEGTDEVNVIVTTSTGINELGSEILLAYPNPVKENLYIQFNPEFNQNVTIRIYDLTGAVKYIEEVNEINPDRLHKVQLSELDLHSGMYLLQINNEENNFIKQIIVE